MDIRMGGVEGRWGVVYGEGGGGGRTEGCDKGTEQDTT